MVAAEDKLFPSCSVTLYFGIMCFSEARSHKPAESLNIGLIDRICLNIFTGDCGDHVVVINSKHIAFSGNKWEQKVYSSHTG